MCVDRDALVKPADLPDEEHDRQVAGIINRVRGKMKKLGGDDE